MVSYIIDENGNKTHVVVPMEKWLYYSNLAEEDIDKYKNTEVFPIIIKDDYPMKHLEKMVPLVEAMDYDSVDKWKKEYKSFFRYMEGLKHKDIDMLYLIRSDEFRNMLSKYEDAEKRNTFSFYYSIVSRNSGNLTLKEAKELNDSLYRLNDEEFLNFFNKNYKHTTEDKKIRIEAEINRLFIYDLMEIYPKYMELEYDITKKEAQAKLMKFLYEGRKGAKTQVQRALKEANIRIVF